MPNLDEELSNKKQETPEEEAMSAKWKEAVQDKLSSEEIKIEREKILSKFPDQLQQEFRIERQDPIEDDIKFFNSFRMVEPEPVSMPLEELLKTNESVILRSAPDVIEEINEKWGTKFDSGLSKVYDQNPDRVRKYSQMPPETASPSVLVDGEIMFGVGRFIAALLRKDGYLKVWSLSKKIEDKK